ncbi:Ubiquitin carboxyl-terminal hydrolase 36 [Boothiomyces sp. JEL0866]|nr:Ubiquitin carboxyl-terminal hydrolase 36 [Boothiomyces sp. JEL0866]
MDISIDIKNCNSIEQALLKYTAPEYLNKDNQYKCNKLRDAEKRITIHESPEILTLQLKRFGYRPGSKVTRHIKFPERLLLDPYLSANKITGKKVEYELYGVLMHSGHSTNSGHYFSFVKHTNGCWYKMNDEEVHPVNVQTVLSQCAYMLFYSRIGGKKPILKPRNGEKEFVESHLGKNGHKKIKVGHNPTDKPQNSAILQKSDILKVQVPATAALPLITEKEAKAGPSPNKVNSTSHWAVRSKSVEISLPSNNLNSTMPFNVKPLKKKDSDFLKSIGVHVPFEERKEKPTTTDTKVSAERNSLKPKEQKSNDIIDITNVQKITPLEAAKGSGIVSWNHLATTDVVFNRNRAINELDSKKKRKRASRDDMEYDAPQLKGLKKKLKKKQQNFNSNKHNR